jgi:hypothetical protein
VSAKSVLLFMSGGQAAISDEIICGAAVGGGDALRPQRPRVGRRGY